MSAPKENTEWLPLETKHLIAVQQKPYCCLLPIMFDSCPENTQLMLEGVVSRFFPAEHWYYIPRLGHIHLKYVWVLWAFWIRGISSSVCTLGFFFSIISLSHFSFISTGDLVILKLYAVNINTIASSAAVNRKHRRGKVQIFRLM